MAQPAKDKRTCERCGKEYQPRANGQRYCSTRCVSMVRKKNKHKKRDAFYTKYFDIAKEKFYTYKNYRNFLQRNKYKIESTDERVIDYNSPTGKAYIGIAKKPLAKVVEGFGYKGVLMQTENRELVQCHECGKWFRMLAQHIRRKHKLSKEDYTKKFNLSENRSLIPDAQSYKLEDATRKRNLKQASPEHLRKFTDKAIKATKERWTGAKHSEEYHNKFGTCEKQLGFRLEEYIKRYKDLPSRSTKGEGGKLSKALHRRYGSLNNGFKHYGFAARYRKGTSVELLAGNGEQFFFNYNKVYSKEDIYTFLIKNRNDVRHL